VSAQNLRIPGPTPLPDRVREAGSWQMVNHRGPEFKALFGRVSSKLQTAFETSNEVLITGSSGTGGLEAAVVNHLSPGDPVLSVSIGVFGDRIASIATTYGAAVTKPAMEWGKAAQPDQVRDAIRGMQAAGTSPKAVLITFNETSTGVTNPLADLAAAVHESAPDALVIVDGVSGIGALPFHTDAWGIDVAVTGAQKAWMIPPGLAMVAVSPRAWETAESATMPRFYFDLKRHRDAAVKGETPWTPAVGIYFQLDVAFELIEAEGYPAIQARHAACGAAARAGLAAMGFQLFAEPAYASNTVTSAHLPEEVEWSALSKALRARNTVLAGGQGKLTGKVFRIGHLGAVNVDDIVRALEALEDAAREVGIAVSAGGPAAAAAAGEAAAAAAKATA
jgi:aspartate aminotransferase-like enzyme